MFSIHSLFTMYSVFSSLLYIVQYRLKNKKEKRKKNRVSLEYLECTALGDIHVKITAAEKTSLNLTREGKTINRNLATISKKFILNFLRILLY